MRGNKGIVEEEVEVMAIGAVMEDEEEVMAIGAVMEDEVEEEDITDIMEVVGGGEQARREWFMAHGA